MVSTCRSSWGSIENVSAGTSSFSAWQRDHVYKWNCSCEFVPEGTTEAFVHFIPGPSLDKPQPEGRMLSSYPRRLENHRPILFDEDLYKRSCTHARETKWWVCKLTSMQAAQTGTLKKRQTDKWTQPWPLLCVEDGKDVLCGHKALFHISYLQVIQG